MINSINNFALSRLNNQEVAALHGNVLRLLSSSDLAALDVTSGFVSQYEGQLAKLTDQVYSNASSVTNAQMKEADAARAKIYSRIHSKLTFAPLAEEGSELKKLGDKVQTELLAKYNGRVPQMAQQEETAVIKGFIFDLNERLTEDEQELLGIAGDIMKLEKANNDFQKAYLSRTDERADADLSGKTTGIRLELSDLYTQLCIKTQYWANNPADDAKVKREGCQAFVSRLNVILADALSRLRQRRKKQGESTDDDDLDTPKPDSGSNGSGSGSNSGSNTNGSGTGSNSGNNTSGSGSGSNTSDGDKDYNDHDGIAEW